MGARTYRSRNEGITTRPVVSSCSPAGSPSYVSSLTSDRTARVIEVQPDLSLESAAGAKSPHISFGSCEVLRGRGNKFRPLVQLTTRAQGRVKNSFQAVAARSAPAPKRRQVSV